MSENDFECFARTATLPQSDVRVPTIVIAADFLDDIPPISS